MALEDHVQNLRSSATGLLVWARALALLLAVILLVSVCWELHELAGRASIAAALLALLVVTRTDPKDLS